MKKLIRNRIFIVSSVTLIFLIVGGYFLFRTKAPIYTFVETAKGDLTQEVSVTGKVKPAEFVDLALESSGRIAWKNVKVGDKVKAGQVLLQLSNDDTKARLSEAEASLKSQQAKLEELKRGTRPEEIQIYETKLSNAQSSLSDAKNSLRDKIQDAYLKSDDSVRNKADKFFSNSKTSSAHFDLPINDFQLKIDLDSKRVLIESILNSWGTSLMDDSTVAKNNLAQISDFFDKLALAANGLTPSSSLLQTTIDSYKADVFSARTNISLATTNVISSDEKLKNAESALSLAQKELDLKRAGTSPEQIIAQEASVQQAQASINNFRAQLSKTYLVSPISGVVTKVDVNAGEIASASKNVVSVMSEKKFKIETDVPEADIAKINIDEEAVVTLDAYGDTIKFYAKVSMIDPAETIIEGVSTYKVTLEFTNEDERVLSGMTANLDITSDKKMGVIAIPQRAITEKNGTKTVEILVGDKAESRVIETGLRGNNGNIEVTKGLNEGEKVITSTIATK